MASKINSSNPNFYELFERLLGGERQGSKMLLRFPQILSKK